MKDNSSLFFKPWIGENYGQNKRVLLLGESHYDTHNNASENFTIEIVQEMIDWADYKYYKNAGFLFDSQNHRTIWNNVAFSNIIQRPFVNGSSQPKSHDIDSVPDNFRKLLNILKPDKFIVLSKRLWNWLPDAEGKMVGSIKIGKRHSNIWEFDNGNGNSSGIGICHPSWMFGKNGSVKEWSLVVDKFLE